MFALKCILLTTMAAAVMGCACTKVPVGEIFCQSSFVGIVRVASGPTLSGLLWPKCHIYELSHVRKLKPDSPDIQELSTATSLKHCGVNLVPGRAYFITGTPNDRYYETILRGTLTISACDYVEDWDAMDEKQRSTFIDYGNNVNCSLHV
ncbi:hypothetical protein HDE_04077 [Halotydeus destructor]|nr:hypothetical protein HDE_04077 [Halotydeus destructor]